MTLGPMYVLNSNLTLWVLYISPVQTRRRPTFVMSAVTLQHQTKLQLRTSKTAPVELLVSPKDMDPV